MGAQSRRQFLKSVGGGAAGALACGMGLTPAGCAGRRRRPNVLLVLTDDQGYGDIGAHGNPTVQTPTLDALYRQSVRLINFHTDPMCSPTRAALLTGQYAARSGVWHTARGRALLAADRVTVADLFQSAGYRTGIFGKWHLGENYPFRPQDRGFEETLIFRSGAVGAGSDYWGNSYFDDTYLRNGKNVQVKGYCNDVWNAAAIQFIRAHRDRPFFCYLPTNLPHAPLNVADRYAAPYRARVSERLAHYYGMVTAFDEGLAGLLAELRRLGLEDDTVLIFAADNGPCPWFGGNVIDDHGFVVEGFSAGMRGAKISGYENAHREPCYVRWPGGGIGGGQDVDRLTAHFDLLPTLLDCCGIQPPAGLAFDGVSLLPLLRDPQAPWAERTICVQNQRVDFPVKYKDFEVLTERWRLVQRPSIETDTSEAAGGQPGRIEDLELYEIRRDPGQRHDVAAQHSDVVAQLRARYDAWWQDVSACFNGFNGIVIGSQHEQPTTLFGQDAHHKDGRNVWVVDVASAGEYAFRVSRWPAESGKKILEDFVGEPLAGAVELRLQVGNVARSCPVDPDMEAADFSVHLAAGRTCIEAGFEPPLEESLWFGAIVTLERRGPADPQQVAAYRPSDPLAVLRAKS